MAGIFKPYDIRGIVGEALNPARAYLIGRALAAETYHGESPIVVSRDMRSHSPGLAEALARGLAEGGCRVLDIGLAATPMNYWANNRFKSRGSITVTASHNGPAYNGVKVSGPGALPVDYSTGLDKVEAWVLRAEAEGTPPALETPGTVETVPDVLPEYLDWMAGFVEAGTRPVKIAVDTANGMGGYFIGAFCERFPWLEAVPLYWELDGTFPNHEADPLRPENLVDVQALVKAQGCDFGVAFDGDADRCMFVDEQGVSISSDLITAMIAGKVLEKNPGSPILYDLRSSHAVPEWISEHGGTPVRGRVGHSFMKRLLREQNAAFGGELSGHYYFRECFNTDSGLMALVQVLNLFQELDGPLSAAATPLRRYSHTGELNYHVRDVKESIRRVEERVKDSGAKLDYLDGLTVEYPDWWFNLRGSNTEPVLRLNLEAGTKRERNVHRTQVEDWLEE